MKKLHTRLYDIVSERYKDLYRDANPRLRPQMIADFERLVEKYSGLDLIAIKADTIKVGHSFDVRPDISQVLRNLRVNHGLTLEKLSEGTELCHSTVEYHEAIKNPKKPGPRSISKYATFYGVDSRLFYLSTEKKDEA